MSDKIAYEKADLKRAQEYARMLAAQIKAAKFTPDLVVGVETGGHLIGKIIANELLADFDTLRVRRKSSKLTHSDIMRKTIGTRRSKIRGVVLNFLFPFMSPKVENASLAELSGNLRILIVDDGVQTGKTMEFVKKILIKKGARPENIKTAVVNVIGKKYRPDFVLTNKRIIWPWSVTHREYKVFRRWAKRERTLRQRKRQESKMQRPKPKLPKV